MTIPDYIAIGLLIVLLVVGLCGFPACDPLIVAAAAHEAEVPSMGGT
jgi:hypothetical protein